MSVIRIRVAASWKLQVAISIKGRTYRRVNVFLFLFIHLFVNVSFLTVNFFVLCFRMWYVACKYLCGCFNENL